MVNNFSDMTFNIVSDKLTVPTGTGFNYNDLTAVYRGDGARHIVSLLLIEEMGREKGEAYVYLPCSNDALRVYVDNVVKLYRSDIRINIMVDMVKSSEDEEYHNLSTLSNVLPLALAPGDNYRFWYNYVSHVPDGTTLTPYPYFILLSNVMIAFSRSVDEAVVVGNSAVVNNLHTYCENCLSDYKELVNGDSDIVGIVKNFVTNQQEKGIHYCIEYEPCFAMFFTEEMVDAMIPAHIQEPLRSQLHSILLVRREQLAAIKKSIQLFNRDAIMEFALNGVIHEFPKAFSRPCTPEERRYILGCLLDMMKRRDKEHMVRAVNPARMNVSDCFSFIVQDDSCIQFTVFNDDKMPMRFLTVTESTLGAYFKNFIVDCKDTDILYTYEVTLELVKKAIEAIPEE